MCIRDRAEGRGRDRFREGVAREDRAHSRDRLPLPEPLLPACLLYTSDAADERSSVDLGGRRIIKKKKYSDHIVQNNAQRDQRTCITHKERR